MVPAERARLLAAVLCGLCLTACGETHTPDAGSGIDAGPPLPDYETFHLEETDVSVNLGLDWEGGTFRHGIDLCSLSAYTEGRLVLEGEQVLLLPREGSDGIGWYSGGLGDTVPEVRLRPDARGLTAQFELGGSTIEEQWLTGGLCPDCEAGGGARVACENPFGG